ncbi:MAG: hypothetical protein IPG80_12365 [Anaerolineales bacterium]|uniref:hypothetical protein n=1 Tax=Candidatus Villigracilis vicinus TaxID=3140679 RepID=UPI003134777D|nr:hypothetical protein [Anaerolineales bacterium]
MPLDINLSPLYRIQGQEPTEMPGVLAVNPPKTAARGREQDRLVVYLALTGNATITTTEYRKFAEDIANVFYQTPRAVTSALRAAADSLNRILLERNMGSTSRGQYTLAWLALAALRENQCIFSLSGPMHAYWFGANGSRHFFEPSISGKGLGSSQTINIHYAQTDLVTNDLLLFCGRVPNAWVTPLEDAQPSSFDAMRRRLTSLTGEDLNAVLIQTTEGTGTVNLFRGAAPTPQIEPAEQPEQQPVVEEEKIQDEVPAPPVLEPDLPATNQEVESTPETGAHLLQPSAYAIPVQHEDMPPAVSTPAASPLASLPQKTIPRDFPASIPRAKPKTENDPIPTPALVLNETQVAPAVQQEIAEPEPTSEPVSEIASQPEVKPPPAPREPSPQTRQAAKAVVNVMQAIRNGGASLGERFRNFLPRLLPAESPVSTTVSSTAFMGFMAVLIPLIVVTLSVVVYLRYGRNEQYDVYYNQALQTKQQALTLTNPVEQRIAWENVIANAERAEEHRQTNDTINLKKEANANRDVLLGITRLQFNPAFSSKLGVDVSRMVASENDLYLLNAANGEIMRAIPSGSGGFELDTTFDCKPGSNNSAGPLVDILALPITNIYGATVLGIDASGNLLYCKPGGPPQTGLLPAPDTNWGRITSFILDGGNLYVLDAPSRAVWVYTGKEAAFVDRPYFFFGQQTPTQDVIDFLVTGDEMYLLHADGRISNCFFSRVDTAASKCQDPLVRVNPFPAYSDMDLFSTAHFTQILFAAPPDPSMLLLDSDGQSIMRFAPRSMELQNQFLPTSDGNPVPRGPVGAVAVSPDHVLYIAVNGQVYFAVNMP